MVKKEKVIKNKTLIKKWAYILDHQAYFFPLIFLYGGNTLLNN